MVGLNWWLGISFGGCGLLLVGVSVMGNFVWVNQWLGISVGGCGLLLVGVSMVNIFGWVESVEGEVVAMCIWLKARLWCQWVFEIGCRLCVFGCDLLCGFENSWVWIWDFIGCDLGFVDLVWFGVPMVFQRWWWCLVGLVFQWLLVGSVVTGVSISVGCYGETERKETTVFFLYCFL